MLVGAAAVREGFRGDVIVAAVADEEVGSVGTEALVRRTTADAAIVTEPTEEVVAIAHKGFVAFEVETAGFAAHGSRPDLGIDAIAAMGPMLSGIAELDARLRSGDGHPLLGTGSLHASVIEGGQEYSSYPASCRLLGERRTIPGETVEHVRVELEALAAGTGAIVSLPFHRGPFETAADEAVVAALHRHLGHDEVGGVPFWADSALLAEAGIPTVVFGPIVGGLHGVDEWVDLASLERCYDAYLAVARELCAMSRLRVVHVGVGLWGRTWAEHIAHAPGYRLVGVADAGAAAREWAEQALAVPTFRDLARALAARGAGRRRARLAALDPPAARRARARSRAVTSSSRSRSR